MDLRQRLRIDLRDEEYRHAYADEQLNLSIGTQIKVIREAQDMKQVELAHKVGTQQAGISRLESANYSGWSIAVLRRLAKAFDLRLRVSFEEFGTLWNEVENFNRGSLERRQFRDDPEFSDTTVELSPLLGSGAADQALPPQIPSDKNLNKGLFLIQRQPVQSELVHSGALQSARVAL
jgi:transcriptional regulator with XRE-family HTH domain